MKQENFDPLRTGPQGAKPRHKAVIFDLDDTLISWANAVDWDTQRSYNATCLHEALSTGGHQLPPIETFTDTLHTTFREIWRTTWDTWETPSFGQMLATFLSHVGLDPTTLDMEEVQRQYGWGLVPGVDIYPSSIALLERLAAQGYKLGLVTNSAMPMWMRDIELEAFGLLPFFDARITSGDTGFIKPHSAIFARILNLLKVRPEEAIFVGDNPQQDIAGANAVGLTSVLIDPPHLDRPWYGIQPQYTIRQPIDLLSLVAELDGWAVAA